MQLRTSAILTVLLLMFILGLSTEAQASNGQSVFASKAAGQAGRSSYQTGVGRMGMGGRLRSPARFTSSQNQGFAFASTAVIAPGSVNSSAIPSGSFNFGFRSFAPSAYRGSSATASSGANSWGAMLPPTATSSVDINTVDCPFLRSSGGGPLPEPPIAPPSYPSYNGPSQSPAGPSPDGLTDAEVEATLLLMQANNQGPPQLPYEPGSDWLAIYNSHDGSLLGYKAPGETDQQFFSGESGHLLPGNEEEGQIILWQEGYPSQYSQDSGF